MPGHLGYNLRHALSRVRRSPGLFVATTLVVALAMAAVASMHVLLDALVFREVPVVLEPSGLVYAQLVRDSSVHSNIPLEAVAALAHRQRSFRGTCGFSTGGLHRIEISGATTLNVTSLMTPACVPLLGIRPHLGRLIEPQDDPVRGVAAIVVLGYDYWRSRFGADPAAIGRTLIVEGAPHRIVGVAQEGFKGLGAEVSSDIFLPINYNRVPPPDPRRGLIANYIVGRLNRGVSIESAQGEVDSLWPSIREETMPPAFSAAEIANARRNRLHLESLARGLSSYRARFATPLVLLTGVAGLLFLVASINVAGLLIGDAAARQEEFAVRMALGASRRHVIQQVLTETGVSLVAGIMIAVPLAWWIGRTVIRLIWTGIAPPSISFTPSWRVVALGLSLTVIAGLTIGLMPAIVAGRTRGLLGLRTAVLQRARWSRPLLVGQVGLSIAIAFGAGLLSHSLINLERIDPGFRTDHLIEARLLPVTNGYAGLNAPVYYDDLTRRVGALPGVKSVALSQTFPSPILSPQTAALAGIPPTEHDLPIDLETVSPHLLETTGIALLEGRDFRAADTLESTPVVIVTRGLARRLFPSGHALGQRIRIGNEPQRASLEIIGIAGDPRFGNVRLDPTPAAFRPYSQEPATLRQPIILALTSDDPETHLGALEQTIVSLGREYTVGPDTVAHGIGQTITQERAMAAISACFAGFVSLLAFVGLFARLANDVRRRTPELGVRMALGASPGAIHRLILRDVVWIVGMSVALGVPAALLAGRASRAVLFELSPYDPVTLTVVAGAFVLIGLAATLIPTRRACAIDPVDALRTP